MKKNLSLIGLFAAIIFFAGSCDKSDNQSGLTFSATPNGKKSIEVFSPNATVVITDFRIAIKDIEFEIENEAAGTEAEFEYTGPYFIDLLNDNTGLEVELGNITLTDGVYSEIEFDLHKSRTGATTDPLYDRSIYIEGTIDGKKFIMFHDTSEKFEVKNKNGAVYTVDGNQTNFQILFSIAKIINGTTIIDFSKIEDGNNNGIYEISPNDPDGNKDIAEQLKNNIKQAADLIENKD